MISPVLAGMPALAFTSLGGPASGLGGDAPTGRGAGHLADRVALSHAAQSALTAGAAGVIAAGLQSAVDQLEADLTKLFMLLGLSRDVASRMARSISGALSAGIAATPDAAGQLADTAAATGQAGAGPSVQGAFFAMSLSVTTRTIEITVDRTAGTIAISYAETSVSLSVQAGTVQQSDPLILDLGDDGIALSGLEAGVDFDLNGDGAPERASWITCNDALLAYDRNGNGAIDGGRELFGDQHGAADGFAELGRFDANGDGAIDDGDPVFGSLLLLDAQGGTRPLADGGVTRIRLGTRTQVDLPLAGGRLAATASFDRADGTQGTVGEALCDVRA